MPPTLNTSQQNLVDSRRKSQKPSVYDPNGTTPTTISLDFEAWLILTPSGPKSKMLDWINTILQSEADKDYEDLLKETLDAEKSYLDLQLNNLSSKTQAFDDWRNDPGIQGWQDVAEIGWLMQELQQGISPYGDKEEVVYLEQLRKAADARFPLSKESVANREQRLKAWISALNSY